MLDHKYFESLGAPDAERLRRLPLWAVCYERELRALASWWHDARRGRPGRACPVPREPPADRVLSLPVWAFEWINTLRFEVHWQRHQVQPQEPPRPIRCNKRPGPLFPGVLA